jgi:chromosome segregation ATPase
MENLCPCSYYSTIIYLKQKQMNYFNKTLAAAIIAGAMSLTSCVENEVAPEVKQLREAQVALLKAQAEMAAADAEFKRIENEHQAALLALELQREEANLTVTLARVEADLAEIESSLAYTQRQMELAELNHQQALVRLEREIELWERSNSQSDAYAARDAFFAYKSEKDQANSKRSQKITKEAELARAKLLLSASNNGLSYDYMLSIYNNDLVKLQGELAAQEAALESLEEVTADPSSAQAEADELTARREELKKANLALDVEITKATQAVTAAEETLGDANEAIEEYEMLSEDLEELNEDIETITLAEEEVSVTIAEAEAELARREARLVEYEAAQDTYVKALEAAEAELATAVENEKDARTTYNVAQNEFKIAIQDYWTPSDLDLASQEYGEVKTKYDSEEERFNNYQTWYNSLTEPTQEETDEFNAAKKRWDTWKAAFNPYNTAYGTYKEVYMELATAQNNKDQAQSNLDKYYNDVATAERGIERQVEKIEVLTNGNESYYDDQINSWIWVNYEESLTGIQEALASLNKEKAGVEAEMALQKTAYDDAVANLEELEASYKTARDAKDALSNEYAANESMRTNLKQVIDVIQTQLDYLNGEIDAYEALVEQKQDEIAGTKEAIALKEAQIANKEVDKTEAEARIADLEANIESLQAEIEAHLELAAQHKERLDAILGNE